MLLLRTMSCAHEAPAAHTFPVTKGCVDAAPLAVRYGGRGVHPQLTWKPLVMVGRACIVAPLMGEPDASHRLRVARFSRLFRGLFPVLAPALLLAAGCDDLSSRKLIKDGNDDYRKGDFKAAVAKYDEALKLNPTLAKGWVNRAYACQAMFTPGATTPENNKAADCIIESLEKAFQLLPDRKDLLNLKIQAQIDAARYDVVIAYFKGLVTKDPRDLESVKTLPGILLRAGKAEEALEWYKKRTELEPENPEGYYAIGVFNWERLHDKAQITGEKRIKMADEAIAPLSKALQLNPKYIDAMTYINLVYRERALGWDVNVPEQLKKQQEDTAKANEWQQKALKLLREAAPTEKKEPPKDDKSKEKKG